MYYDFTSSSSVFSPQFSFLFVSVIQVREGFREFLWNSPLSFVTLVGLLCLCVLPRWLTKFLIRLASCLCSAVLPAASSFSLFLNRFTVSSPRLSYSLQDTLNANGRARQRVRKRPIYGYFGNGSHGLLPFGSSHSCPTARGPILLASMHACVETSFLVQPWTFCK